MRPSQRSYTIEQDPSYLQTFLARIAVPEDYQLVCFLFLTLLVATRLYVVVTRF